MFNLKDLDLSHITQLSITIVEPGATLNQFFNCEKDKMVEVIKECNHRLTEEPASTDYSQSKFCQFVAHPEFINRIMTWLHLHIDGQKDTSDKIKPIYALTRHRVFTAPIPLEVFVSEFGQVNQSLYSRYLGSNSNFVDSEVETLYNSFRDFDFDTYLKKCYKPAVISDHIE